MNKYNSRNAWFESAGKVVVLDYIECDECNCKSFFVVVVLNCACSVINCRNARGLIWRKGGQCSFKLVLLARAAR